MTKYDLYIFLKEEPGNGSKDLVTRPSGEKIRRRVERDMEKTACRGRYRPRFLEDRDQRLFIRR